MPVIDGVFYLDAREILTDTRTNARLVTLEWCEIMGIITPQTL